MPELDKIPRDYLGFAAMAAAAIWLFPSVPARADSLTLLTAYLENGAVVCSNSSTTASACGTFAQSVGSLAAGTLGVIAQFPPGGLPLPNMLDERSVEALASASLQYNFTASVPSGTAVFTLVVDGTTTVSNTPATIPGLLPAPCSLSNCQAGAALGIPQGAGEAFVGLPGEQSYGLANILNSGSANGPYTVQISAPVINGSVDFTISLGAFADCPSLTVVDLVEGEACSAVADYLDPLTIAGASVFGANGNLIPGATLISQSGYDPIVTPEPSSILLLGTGAALLGLGLTTNGAQRPL